MMVCVLVPLFLIGTFSSVSSAGWEPASLCPHQWLLFGQRCFAFYPVWSSWSNAKSLCSQTGSDLVALHTPEERHFVRQITNTHVPVWLGGHQAEQNGSWFWSDSSPFRISGWTDQKRGETTEGGVCMEMEPISGRLTSAPCGELRFYICSIKAGSSSTVCPSSRKQAEPDIVPGVSLFDIVWSYSDLLAEEVLHSSSFLRDLRSGQLTERCYTSFIQQEALYLHRVSSTLEALISRPQEADDMRSLLLDTFKQYSSRNQSLPPALPPQWLHLSLQSFHSVVLEEPIYWLVALSARARLRNFLAQELLLYELRPEAQSVSGSTADSFYQEWTKDSVKEVAWTHRFRRMMEEYQNKMDVFKAINIFREHMINQKRFYRAVDCDAEDDR
ncbi:uncharacterized protein LOC121177372 isoform X2 [Toxotes jaculatrix]|uniref:uncharacterized protein LOC121177372 isoform X2 n=1 Tax=Toxotes jaculatrix TaxID=941984 RepID=UPI001B3ADB33|nr:uncharacterized protein LOC121177372 isoform X2 [Toxotes jaculatrix]XP_040887627.1 uncharacterized protein LOC121177372 isoform X2 [Toxotes jaculatrix]XP_040887628.1 uncharacterized protein LOC121177372 isoform X2 [Toxotes jaculatrix]XP_040887629.1 uncharacterized protein LOC121177372 isoform X2 [Toxotes jaculatrix]